MAIVKTCCLWNLRTGSYVCAAFIIIFSLIIIGFSSFETIYYFEDKVDSNELVFTTTLSVSEVVLGILMIASSILLIVGIYKDYRFLLMPFIVVVIIYSTVEVVGFAYGIYDQVSHRESPNSASYPGVFWFTKVFAVFEAYCVICVISQFQELKAGRGTKEYFKKQKKPTANYFRFKKFKTNEIDRPAHYASRATTKDAPSFTTPFTQVANGTLSFTRLETRHQTLDPILEDNLEQEEWDTSQENNNVSVYMAINNTLLTDDGRTKDSEST